MSGCVLPPGGGVAETPGPVGATGAGSLGDGLPADLCEDLPDGLLVADERGTVVRLNVVGARLLGIAADQAVGRRLVDVLPLVDQADRSWWTCADPYASLSTVTGQPERWLRLPRPDGPEALLSVTARYVRAELGGPVVRVVVSFRLDRRRQREEDDQAALIATVAHELRNPMTSVRGFTRTLLRSWDRFTDEQRKEMLATVHADAERVTRLINDLLYARRIESGRVELRPSLVDPAAVLAGIVSGRVSMGRPPGLKADDVRVDVADDLPEWWADGDKVLQVLDNLIDNSLLHGRPPVRVNVGAQAGPDGEPQLVITVDDAGAGFSAAATRRAFDKFWRADEGTRGTGLGLYISRGLVEAHGGTMTAERASGGGGRVRVVVPTGSPPAEG